MDASSSPRIAPQQSTRKERRSCGDSFLKGFRRLTGLAVDGMPGCGVEYEFRVGSDDQQVPRRRVDGTDREAPIDRVLRWPGLIAVDRLEGGMCLTSIDGIERANLYGSGREKSHTDVCSVAAIALSR